MGRDGTGYGTGRGMQGIGRNSLCVDVLFVRLGFRRIRKVCGCGVYGV